MAKFYGKIGYIKTIETAPGIWVEQAIEKAYYGDLQKNYSKYQNTDVNGDINISNVISIVADPYACENFQHMRYVIFMGAKWKISGADVQYPRIIINLGGLYNG